MARSGAGRRATTDEALIRWLYEEHGCAVLAYTTRLMGDRQAAEDVVQETMLQAWRHPEVMVNGKGSVRGWLLTVARNLVIDRTRARAARPREVPPPAEETAVAVDHAEAVVDSVVVLQALELLSPDHRAVLTATYLRGKSVAEAAEELDIPTGTVRSRAFYALQTLRTHLVSDGAIEGVST